MEGKYLCVMGTLGCGKTTVSRLLAGELELTLLEEKFAENPFLPRFYKDMERWAFDSQMFFLTEKIGQVKEAERLLVEVSVLQDTPIQQDVYGYAKAQMIMGNMSADEWKLYLRVFEMVEEKLPKPDLVVYLEASIATLMERIRGRDRKFEEGIDESYLRLLDEVNKTWLMNNNRIEVMKVDTNGLDLVGKAADKKKLVGQVKERLVGRR